MKLPGWVPRSMHMPPSARWDAFLLPALFVLNSLFFSAWYQLAQVGTEPWLIFVWLYGLAMLVPLVWRNKAPLAVFASQWVLTVVAWPIMPLFTPVVGVPAALHAVAVHRSRKTSLLTLLASFIPLGLSDVTLGFRVYASSPPSLQLQVFITNAIILVIVTIGAWGAGRVTRNIHQHLQRLEGERETVREAVTAERSRIARELHDIVSHAVTAIVLQAAGASRVANTNFAQVTQSLANIEATGKQAMAELRRLLGVLEASEPVDDDDEGIDDLGPQPGLADMTALLASLRDAGMPVTVHVEGTPRSLDPSIDLAAYRIVQEGLTNVLKHGGMDSHPQLRMVWEARNLIIQIDNDINNAAAHRGQALSVGRGLIGLRARAHAVGGRLHAGPHPNGGYRLNAALPLADTPQRILLDHHQ
jgi:signal transduction histidine kinase